jgi:hypothetical protein
MQESLDTSTAMGRFVVDIIQRIAQLESEQIGERVYVGMKQKATTEGGILGFAHPFGYDYIDGELRINDYEANIVKLIFEMYLKGNGSSKIAEELDRLEYKTKRNGVWSARTIGKILKNPIYCGYMKWEDFIFKGTHESLISVEEYQEVQLMILKNTRNSKLKRKPITIEVENQCIEEEGVSHEKSKAVCT